MSQFDIIRLAIMHTSKCSVVCQSLTGTCQVLHYRAILLPNYAHINLGSGQKHIFVVHAIGLKHVIAEKLILGVAPSTGRLICIVSR